MVQPYHHGALRAALLEAAETVLNGDGIGALTLRAVSREAGVSHAAPTHHFGDLTGLLTALAAAGFDRMRERLEGEVAAAGYDRDARLKALGRGYIEFARGRPGLFQLMFRSERLDWSSPALSEAAEAAFALLALDAPQAAPGSTLGEQRFNLAMTRWSLMHGFATLLVDGRIGSLAAKSRADMPALTDAVLACLTVGLSAPAGSSPRSGA